MLFNQRQPLYGGDHLAACQFAGRKTGSDRFGGLVNDESFEAKAAPRKIDSSLPARSFRIVHLVTPEWWSIRVRISQAGAKIPAMTIVGNVALPVGRQNMHSPAGDLRGLWRRRDYLSINDLL